MKFLIAGLGSIGRRHLRNLSSLGERDIVLYRTHRSTMPDDELTGFPVETDLQAALAHRPDAVIVANPTALHLDVAIPAAQAGCHLLLEKPVSHSMARVDELQLAVGQNGCKVLVGFQFRFHPQLQKIKQMLDEGVIGRPLSARAHWGEYLPGWHPWEDYRQSYSARSDLGGGVALTLCQPFDYLRWLLGDVQSLSAFAAQVSDLELSVEDLVEARLHFAGGVVASLHLDYFQRPPSHGLEISGTQGMLRWNNQDNILSVYQIGQSEWRQISPPEGFERNHLFIEEMRHFLALICGEQTSRCSLKDGVWSLKLALAAKNSAKIEPFTIRE